MINPNRNPTNFLSRIIKVIQQNNLGRKGLKKRIRDLKKSYYGKDWQEKDNNFYEMIFASTPLIHKNFMNFLKSKKDVNTVLEIGCGTGIYPIKFKELFSNIKYVGIDISQPAIEYCKNNSKFDFICGDLIKMELHDKYDLVFSNAVIDHVYDIDMFLTKVIHACKKYAYISAYRGYFPNLEKHKMMWNNDKGCYYNDLSVKEIKKNLIQNGLDEDEFIIRPQESGQKGLEIETVIEIHRKNNNL